MNIRQTIEKIASERILILDGAMGVLIQAQRNPSGEPLGEEDFRGLTGRCAARNRFKDHPVALKGCNDLLCLTMPEIISAIHEDYLKAGADIIETCSFSATSIALEDYGLGALSYEISAASARLAKEAAEKYATKDKPRFVAGSMGPTGKSAGISPDLDNPAKRAITWDELDAAYYDNARGLLDGGADIIIIETIFDAINAKAAVFAVKRLAEERGVDVPLIISATVLDSGGRLLTGQTVEAFCVSMLHANPLALGLNCSFGAEKLKPHISTVSEMVPCLVSAYPNAGLPNRAGAYDESPETMAAHIEEYLRDGIVNIAGGCCGSTPAHIARIACAAKQYPPRRPCILPKKTILAGLSVLEVGRERGITDIGERTNVAGSRKFLRLINDGKYDEAANIAWDMAEAGAAIIDVCMDDAMLDAKAAMTSFLNHALLYPEIARLPVMIDSSDWSVIEAGLKCLPGKGIVNSISLKDGEAEFVRKARLVRAYGAAVVVMLFDENGQAVTYRQRIAVAARSWEILTGSGFPAEDIIFDPNVLAAATGIPEHDLYALDFIKACEWIKENCPGAQISGGISNLSFSFRGNDTIREAMHSVFLRLAFDKGLSLAIVNPSTLVPYDEIDRELRETIEELFIKPDAVDGKGTPAEKLLALAETFQTKKAGALNGASGGVSPNGSRGKDGEWRGLPAGERIAAAMVLGIDTFIEDDLKELKTKCKPLEIVEGPLLDGIKEVGDRFGEGRMFLPQVLRAARIMKKAVAILEPDIERDGAASGKNSAKKKVKVLIATVKGDVHDIGKNITAAVLSCNGCEIIDLGVMVPPEQILEKAKEEKADIIGLSGLITPSLEEMIKVAKDMERQGFKIPLLIGGAAASLAHTALHIAPEYSGPVVYVSDAGQAPSVINSLVSEKEFPAFLNGLKTAYARALTRHDALREKSELLPLEDARKNRVKLSWPVFTETAAPVENKGQPLPPLHERLGIPPRDEIPSGGGSLAILRAYPVQRVIPYIDWKSFTQTWELARHTYPSAYDMENRKEEKLVLDKLMNDAKELLEKIGSGGILELRGVAGFFPAFSEGDDIVIPEKGKFAFPRNQERKPDGRPNPCLADFLPDADYYRKEQKQNTVSHNAEAGLFVLSAGFGLREAEKIFRNNNDDYSALLLAGLANSLAEAFSEEVHRRLLINGIRPAFGYPACPDHSDKKTAFKILGAEENCGLSLTDTAMIIPAASVCGLYIKQPDSFYFGTGTIGDDQLDDLAARKGISQEDARKIFRVL